jgi:hypothetical protein
VELETLESVFNSLVTLGMCSVSSARLVSGFETSCSVGSVFSFSSSTFSSCFQRCVYRVAVVVSIQRCVYRVAVVVSILIRVVQCAVRRDCGNEL